MKLKMLSLLAAMAIMVSCSKDDDPAPVESAKLSFAADEEVIDLPAAMLESTDPYASQIAEMVSDLNELTSWTAFAETPEGATKSTTEIVPENGRVARTNGSVVVYIWDDGQGGQFAYQVKDLSDSFLFELLWKVDGKWYRFFSASEKKDKSSGNMVLYNFFGDPADPDNLPTEQIARWDWSRSGDILNFTFTDFEYYKFEMSANIKAKTGTMTSYWGSTVNTTVVWEKESELTWNADGSGTWKEYDNGQVVAQGDFQP
jgi:hypothetical protein